MVMSNTCFITKCFYKCQQLYQLSEQLKFKNTYSCTELHIKDSFLSAINFIIDSTGVKNYILQTHK